MNVRQFDPVTILGIDPGTSTGVVATIHTSPFKLPEIIKSSTILYATIIDDLISILAEVKPDVVVVEDFVVRRSKAEGLSYDRLEVVRVIGIVKTLCHLNNYPMVLQRPVDVTRAKVEPSMRQQLAHHERSAYKHIKYYYYTKHITKETK